MCDNTALCQVLQRAILNGVFLHVLQRYISNAQALSYFSVVKLHQKVTRRHHVNVLFSLFPAFL
ncbi:hypothetical protein PTET_a3058 [Pseudoalteromonas tetraodonis]|uniref:Uncharacterized protein n=1 Tax=Pseudoalteromonas tetraodonis TaxID=43659 RepID=A0ABD4EQY0_9GAMM|nr:hypothetical protein PSM_A2678 [Pseudoalteromonas sp. SM9913]ATD04309.1 hypothetical protein PTET_a3058 [Pseudoalteromonas tetraodonis]KYL36733.1 hypothetical protein A2I96_07155 [Pseudoalteromonas spiralis]